LTFELLSDKNCSAHFYGLLPTFKNKSGHAKPLELLGLRALWPKTHFFFLNLKKIMKLKYILNELKRSLISEKIKELAKKSGHLGRI